jgi:hypothetical protein
LLITMPRRAATAHGTSLTRSCRRHQPVEQKEPDAANPDQPNETLAWTTALADVVLQDRAERVGGKLHALPSIQAR